MIEPVRFPEGWFLADVKKASQRHREEMATMPSAIVAKAREMREAKMNHIADTGKMVERIAEAIYMGRNGHGAKPFRSQPKAHREPYLKDAVCALKALRDPTPAMLQGPLNNPSREPDLWTAIWRAMVDEALKE